MRRGQLFGLILSATAASAAYVAYHRMLKEQKPQVLVVKPQTVEILVAARTVEPGMALTAADLAWKAWPKDLVPSQAVTHASPGEAPPPGFVGERARFEIAAGEPLRTTSVNATGPAGYLASLLKPGYRAVAISIDSQGAATAGNFIMPGDHVDVLQTYQADAKSHSGPLTIRSEIVLSDVRVLAIGVATPDHHAERVVSGSTATLEVTPVQAEQLAQAQRTGQLSLALRGTAKDPITAGETAAPKPAVARVGVVRNGVRQEYSVPDAGMLAAVPLGVATASAR